VLDIGRVGFSEVSRIVPSNNMGKQGQS